MPTTAPLPPNVAPLPGADLVSRWVGDPPHRSIFGVDRTVTDHAVRVYIRAVQSPDGSVAADHFEGAPSVNVANGEASGLDPLNSDQARELASVLLQAADELDGWANR